MEEATLAREKKVKPKKPPIRLVIEQVVSVLVFD
tara:strand:- start:8 stop:109 length:102 start_codon:yes stop_codon:yes gene_type:complete